MIKQGFFARMDLLEYIAIRFHYGGEFLTVGGHLQYFGGGTTMSHIEIDKLSLPEIEGHLADHVTCYGGVQLHWLPPGMEMGQGMRLLYNDKSCSEIAQHITDGGVADIYAEEVVQVEEEKAKDWALDEAEDEAKEMDVDIPTSCLPMLSQP